MSARIGVAGLTGQVSRLVVAEIKAAGHKLVGGTVREGSTKVPPEGVKVFADIDALAAAVDVVIDFTHAYCTLDHAKAVAAHKIAWVNGVSGMSKADEAALDETARVAPVLHAASFAPTASLVPELVTGLAKALPGSDYDVEILETHHHHKVDAPSGTAIAIGRLVAKARGDDFDAVRIPARDGHVAPRKPGGIGIAAIRAGQIIGETTLMFLSDTEEITLTRRVFDRAVYAQGSVQAALWLAGKPAGRYTMRDVLGAPRQ